MADPTISTELVAIFGGLALLTPLVKAVSQWHIALKKISKPEDATTSRQSQSSQTEKKSFFGGRDRWFWIDFFILICRVLMMYAGFAILVMCMRINEPLTTGYAALIALALAAIGNILKDSK